MQTTNSGLGPVTISSEELCAKIQETILHNFSYLKSDQKTAYFDVVPSYTVWKGVPVLEKIKSGVYAPDPFPPMSQNYMAWAFEISNQKFWVMNTFAKQYINDNNKEIGVYIPTNVRIDGCTTCNTKTLPMDNHLTTYPATFNK